MKFGVWCVSIMLGGLLFFVGCKEENTTLYQIPVYEKLESVSFTDVNDYADSVRYVPLETTDSCLIGQIYKIIRWKNYYYISDLSGNLYLFTDTGKFVRKIGVQGRGPDEYVVLTDFIVDPENGDVFLIDYGKVLVCTILGKVQRTFPVDPSLQVCAMDKAKHLIFISPLSNEKESFDLLTICDKEGKVIYKVLGKGEDCDLSYFNWIVEQGGRTYYKPEFSDTLYFLNTAMKVHPYALVDFGKYKLQPALLKGDKKEQWPQYYRLDAAFDFDHFLVLNVQKGLIGKELESYVFDKKKNRVRKWRLEGKVVIPKSAYTNQLICSLTALDLLEHKGKQSAGLQKAISQIEVDSNPVLAVVYLK